MWGLIGILLEDVTVWQGFGGSKHLRGLWSIEATDRDFGASNEILT